MTPEQHRAILLRAASTGDWTDVERATRQRAWFYLIQRVRLVCRAALRWGSGR